jgi:hypothetical protein
MEYYLVYHKETGEVLSRNSGPEGAAYLQGERPDRANFVVPFEIWDSTPLDMAGVKALAAGRIDEVAEACRARFITPGSGQAMTYTYKAEEAKAYLADNTAPTPFLVAEAVALGVTVKALAGEVLARVAEWTLVGSRIEGARMAAKLALSQATNLAEIAQAMDVDWNALLD